MVQSEKIIIVSPHCDDELIGLFEILPIKGIDKEAFIIYTNNTEHYRKIESEKLSDFFNVTLIHFYAIPTDLLRYNYIYYFPDPIYEYHPHHRLMGQYGEKLLRDKYDVIFYSINMQTPYIHQVSDHSYKEDILNTVYPSQKDLWTHDKKYILFEGRCKWIM